MVDAAAEAWLTPSADTCGTLVVSSSRATIWRLRSLLSLSDCPHCASPVGPECGPRTRPDGHLRATSRAPQDLVPAAALLHRSMGDAVAVLEVQKLTPLAVGRLIRTAAAEESVVLSSVVAASPSARHVCMLDFAVPALDRGTRAGAGGGVEPRVERHAGELRPLLPLLRGPPADHEQVA
jgi:hypothetical protein